MESEFDVFEYFIVVPIFPITNLIKNGHLLSKLVLCSILSTQPIIKKNIIDCSLLVSSIQRPDKKCLTFWGQKSLTLVKISFSYKAINWNYSDSAEAIMKKTNCSPLSHIASTFSSTNRKQNLLNFPNCDYKFSCFMNKTLSPKTDQYPARISPLHYFWPCYDQSWAQRVMIS